MAFDGITVAALVHELSDTLTDGRIARIAQPEKDALLLTIKTRKGQHRLLLSASASLPLLYLTSSNRPAPLTAPNFCMLLRKHIGGGRIRSVTQPGLERIVRFEIEHFDELGDLRRKSLIIELMGKHSNIIFCDEENMIIDSIKHISAQTSSVREVLPGRTWFIPDTMNKLDPLSVTEEEFISAVFSRAVPLAKALYSSLTGISPVIAEELCHRAGLDSSRSALTFDGSAGTHLHHLLGHLADDIREHRFTPQIILGDKGEPVEFSAVDLTMYADLRRQEFPDMSSLLEEFYSMREKVTRIRQKSADLRHIAATAAERVGKKYDLQLRQLRDTEKKDKFRLWGELLHTYGYEAAEGAKSLKVINYYTGEEIEIPLDPTKSAAANAEAYFEKYGKMKRTAEALTTLIAQTKADLEQLLSIRTFLDMALTEEDLAGVREELAEAGYIRRRAASPKAKKEKITSAPLHYTSSYGYDFYVGKNNYQNDELTFRFASGSDWWFHAKGAPGSHVILKNKGEEIPDRAFEDAAALAAWYSANRGADKVEIDYVQKRQVKKPNGAKPGFVVYYTNYSMVIKPDISSLTLVD